MAALCRDDSVKFNGFPNLFISYDAYLLMIEIGLYTMEARSREPLPIEKSQKPAARNCYIPRSNSVFGQNLIGT